MSIWSDSLVLAVDQDPKTNLVLGEIEVMRNTALKGAIRLLLQDTEAWQIRGGPILLVERSQVEAFMATKGFVGDHLSIN